jgi:hypothetical protein
MRLLNCYLEQVGEQEVSEVVGLHHHLQLVPRQLTVVAFLAGQKPRNDPYRDSEFIWIVLAYYLLYGTNHGIITEGESSVQLTSSLSYIVL